MHVILVEDDSLQADETMGAIREAYPAAQIELLTTESEFRRRLPEIQESPPDVFIIDIMLRWANPSPDVPEPPPSVQEEGFYLAGFRCESLLAQEMPASKVPVILVTRLDEEDVRDALEGRPDNVTLVPKDLGPAALVAKMTELLRAARRA